VRAVSSFAPPQSHPMTGLADIDRHARNPAPVPERRVAFRTCRAWSLVAMQNRLTFCFFFETWIALEIDRLFIFIIVPKRSYSCAGTTGSCPSYVNENIVTGIWMPMRAMRLGEFSRYRPLSILLGKPISVFRFSIRHIVLMCPKKKMFGINAITNIAVMENVETVCYRAMSQFPGDPVCSHCFALPMHQSVAMIIAAANGAGPEPTIHGFIDVVPKIIDVHF